MRYEERREKQKIYLAWLRKQYEKNKTLQKRNDQSGRPDLAAERTEGQSPRSEVP